jgi:hypothetical protein
MGHAMDHDSDQEVGGAVRALLVVATGDGPPESDLLEEVRRRVRGQRLRRRVLVPSLATLTTASVIAVAALVASVVTGTGTPSAQARVAAAAGRTATEGYRVRIVSTRVRIVSTKSDMAPAHSSSATQTSEGVFDPAQRTGRLLLQGQGQGLEVRFVGDMVYTELPIEAGLKGKRWVAQRRSVDPEVAVPAFVRLTKLAWQDPQQALARLRSAAAVHEQGPLSGDGWSGRRYAFELTDKDGKRGTQVTGTVDVDQSGRVRRLEVTERLTTNAGRTAGTLRTVMEFRDYGAHETVSAPPTGEVTRAPDVPAEVKPVPPKARTEKPWRP